jgi:transposase InsO family protein
MNRPGQAWASDITYIKSIQGWLYLNVIIDLCDREVIVWSFSRYLKADFTTIPTCKISVRNRIVKGKLISRPDRDIQYACHEFKNLLSTYRFVERSRSRKGDLCDNPLAESFFKTLKAEHVNHHTYMTTKEAELSVFEFIEIWYNVNRIHTTIKTPVRNSKEKLLIN